MRHSSDVVFRFSLGKGEGSVKVRIASAACWKTPHLSLLYEKGYVSSAKGAAFIASLGHRPRIHGSETPALKARIISDASETRFQRWFTRRFEFLGRCPQANMKERLWR
jgi:hypothetical protein